MMQVLSPPVENLCFRIYCKMESSFHCCCNSSDNKGLFYSILNGLEWIQSAIIVVNRLEIWATVCDSAAGYHSTFFWYADNFDTGSRMTLFFFHITGFWKQCENQQKMHRRYSTNPWFSILNLQIKFVVFPCFAQILHFDLFWLCTSCRLSMHLEYSSTFSRLLKSYRSVRM